MLAKKTQNGHGMLQCDRHDQKNRIHLTRTLDGFQQLLVAELASQRTLVFVTHSIKLMFRIHHKHTCTKHQSWHGFWLQPNSTHHSGGIQVIVQPKFCVQGNLQLTTKCSNPYIHFIVIVYNVLSNIGVLSLYVGHIIVALHDELTTYSTK